MGQDSPRAAMIYQHATREADRVIADELSALVLQHRSVEPGGHVQGAGVQQ
jgi:hypothetical protein